MLRLLAQERGRVNVVSFNQSEANLRALLTHPLCSVISDGFYVRGLPHPRLHGTFPELLGRIVREKGWMTLTEAVQRSRQNRWRGWAAPTAAFYGTVPRRIS